jgi:hypothetical protein
VGRNTLFQGDKCQFLRHGGACLFIPWKVLVSKFARLGRNAGVGALVLALAFPAGTAFADDPVPSVPSGPDASEQSVAVEADPAIPVGDEGNDPSAGETVSRQVRIAVETAHAFGSPESRDLIGYEVSLYQGKWYMPNRENMRKCLSKIESHHHYKAGGYYQGAYQFSKALTRGVTWMMQPEVRKEMGEAGVDLVKKLRKTPMNKWNRYWQDRAFWTVWNEGKGKNHWRAGQGRCF